MFAEIKGFVSVTNRIKKKKYYSQNLKFEFFVVFYTKTFPSNLSGYCSFLIQFLCSSNFFGKWVAVSARNLLLHLLRFLSLMAALVLLNPQIQANP